MGIINEYGNMPIGSLYGTNPLTAEEYEKRVAEQEAAKKAYEKQQFLNFIRNTAERLFFEKGYNAKKAFKLATEFYEEFRRLEENWE